SISKNPVRKLAYLIALSTALPSNRLMVEEVKCDSIGDPTAFVRDFAAKAYFLFLVHDLGWQFREHPHQRIFGGRADEIGRVVARLVRSNIKNSFVSLWNEDFFARNARAAIE